MKMMQQDIQNSRFDSNKLFAVIVTFYPNDSVLKNIKNILEYYPAVIIVDNTDSKESYKLLSCLKNRLCVEIIYNHKNFGIAEALNQGVRRASELGATWVTTFDQDSWLAVDYPSMIESSIHANSSIEESSIFGCRYIDPSNSGQANLASTYFAKFFETCDEVITSGMTFSVSTWLLLNGFDSELFIDFVDHDFCAKARKVNISCQISIYPVLVHSLGNQSKHKVLWKGVYASNHSPLRRYYMARNTVVYIKRYFRVYPKRAFFHFRQLIRDEVVIILFEKEKIKKMIFHYRGIIDGVRGRLGEI